MQKCEVMKNSLEKKSYNSLSQRCGVRTLRNIPHLDWHALLGLIYLFIDNIYTYTLTILCMSHVYKMHNAKETELNQKCSAKKMFVKTFWKDNTEYWIPYRNISWIRDRIIRI